MRRRDRQQTIIGLVLVVLLVFVKLGWLWGIAASLAVLGGALLADYFNWLDRR